MLENTNKPSNTNEEKAKHYGEYYGLLDSIYPVEKFELKGKDGENLWFYRGSNNLDDSNLYYYLIDEEHKKYLDELKRLQLQGIDMPDDGKRQYRPKAYIHIFKGDKIFNFGVYDAYQANGYGGIIFDSILDIMEMLEIEDKDEYTLAVGGSHYHGFLQRAETKRFVRKASRKPNTEEALEVINEFAKYPNKMKFSEFNTLIEYALNSNVPRERIAEAINENGFNIFYNSYKGETCIEKADVDKFKSFGIQGLKPTSMHQHFIQGEDFSFMDLLGTVDMEDATREFRAVWEEEKKRMYNSKGDKSSNSEQLSALENILLNWKSSGLILRAVEPGIQELAKKQAIATFEKIDPNHYEQWGDKVENSSSRILKMLSDAGLMDKDTFMELYQKALNRNYDLEEFISLARYYISNEEMEEALKEIQQNEYYPSPKGEWQKSTAKSNNHRIQVAKIPAKARGKFKNKLQQEIESQGIARSTIIKTDMTGVGQDGQPIKVNNLQDWLFGVPGAPGNIRIGVNGNVEFPPQTPQTAVDIVQEAIKIIKNADFNGPGGR